MIRFPEIWEKYKRGNLKKLEPETLFKQEETGFSDLDSSGSRITLISSFDDKPIEQEICREFKKTTPDFEKLEAILSKIEPVEESMQASVNNVSLHGHFIRAIRVGDEYDSLITLLEENNYKQFNDGYTLLEKGVTAEYLKEMRAKTDASHEAVVDLHDITKRREITDEILTIHKNRVKTYSTQRHQINKIKAEIQTIKNNYLNCSFDKQGKRDIRQLQKRINNFWGKGLTKEADAINFKEGKEELQKLYDELQTARKNPKNSELQRRLDYHVKKAEVEFIPVNENQVVLEQKHQIEEPHNPLFEKEDDRQFTAYSLSMHVFSIGYPKSFQYFPLRSSLVGRMSWDRRFEQFNKQIKELVITKNAVPLATEDKQYLKSLAEGMYLATQKPEPNFPVQTAKKTYETLQLLIS